MTKALPEVIVDGFRFPTERIDGIFVSNDDPSLGHKGG
jgi:hypothetical protein